MTDRTAWFAYSRAHPGKIRARPIHPIGWALLLGSPLPGILAGARVKPITGGAVALMVAFAITALYVYMLFAAVRRRGRLVD